MGFRVRGKLAPETVKPVPVTVAALTVTAALPVEVKVSDWVAGEFKITSPKATIEALTLSVGTAVPSCRAKVSVTLLALAVRVTVCAVLTEETVAAKLALVAPAATVTLDGRVTAGLLLTKPTVKPPLAAAAFSDTVQLSVPAPVIDPLLQLSALSTGTPVPLRLTTVEDPVEELLVSVSCPVTEPAVVGSNWTVRVAI